MLWCFPYSGHVLLPQPHCIAAQAPTCTVVGGCDRVDAIRGPCQCTRCMCPVPVRVDQVSPVGRKVVGDLAVGPVVEEPAGHSDVGASRWVLVNSSNAEAGRQRAQLHIDQVMRGADQGVMVGSK
jgi:hypothetical protein